MLTDLDGEYAPLQYSADGRFLFAVKDKGGVPAKVYRIEVTSRQANLHNEMMDLLDLDERFRMPPVQSVYCVAYRPMQEGGVGRIETWAQPLTVGQCTVREAIWAVEVEGKSRFQGL